MGFMDHLHSERTKALGQIDMFGLIAGQLMREYNQANDPLLQELSNKLYDVMKQMTTARAPLTQNG